MSDNGRRIGSPTPTASSTRKQDGGVIGRNRAASTAKSILSTTSGKTISNLQLSGSKKVNTAPPWARHEPPSPEGEMPTNTIHTFLGTGNLVHQNESQQHLNVNASGHFSASSQTSSVRGGRREVSDVASMTSSAPDQMSEPQQGQATWWPFSLPSVPIPLRKNSFQQGQGSSLTSPFQSLFAQTQRLIPVRAPEDKLEGPEADQPNGSAGGALTGGDDEETPKPKSTKDRPRVQWLFDRAQVRKQGWLTEEEMRQQPPQRQTGDAEGQDNDTYVADDEGHEEAEDENGNKIRRRLKRPTMQISIPRRGKGPFTEANSKTPGWEQPWTPTIPPRARVKGQGGKEGPSAQNFGASLDEDTNDGHSNDVKALSKKQQRTQTFRTWILHSNAVPLIIRAINVSFTTATLAVAISIRHVETRHGLVGAVGSSPILAIIFAPPTLIHVLVAIYLEYFGKPLGLWRTSGKLLHTLLEMLFICMWSASLSLAFDNFFTSRLGCAPTWTTRWWNHLPSPPPLTGQGRHEGGPADDICDEQLALICLVFFGLTLYCGSLIISLFRIFEKVKYHSTDWALGMRGLGSRLGRV